ncbi:E3 SUMO-protein ligase ZBED1-like [Drosophila nasuta]|uniref:E3 SUMO-protein ligase ZBED1-like n=1 Tax=Drosophila nasuta TaxID=42062 RepID=UPI00295E23A2|nr:E3 SUMO-protein ligase ZBED1-like [Drosophila nasuta]
MEKFLTIVEKAKRRSSTTPSSDVEVACECSSADSDASDTQQEALKRKKGISKVWKYFKRSDAKKLAKCLNCGKEYKTSGNTSNLRDHLKRFHPGIDDAVAKPAECNDSNLPASSSSSTRSSMHSISSYFKPAISYDTNSRRKRDIDRVLAKMIAKDVQPFNIVEWDGFIEYSQILDPRFKIPSKTHLRDVLVKGILDEAVLTLKTKLRETTSVAVTCDCWTSSANDAFLTVTCHFIDGFQFRTASLSTEKLKDATNHSAPNIAETLKGVSEQFNVLDKTVCIVTDNASAMLKACDILKIRNLPCFAHSLNLVVQDALKMHSICAWKTYLKNVRPLSNFLRKALLQAQNLKKPKNPKTRLACYRKCQLGGTASTL